MMMQTDRPIELWAGAECTVNRVGDVYFDQLERTGHAERLQDLERLAELGVRRVRFPMLWERSAARRGAEPDFRWSDVRLAKLAALGIEPVLGLVHHGSGPAYTDLCDAGFAPGLAAFAEQVARRYPWVKAYTPVNEPLTTARFACLYGLWYPHQKELGAFVRALLNQVHAIRASMAAIRRINPEAELYQTEDLGQTFATPDLEEQCRYERARRWLSLDLLFGRVGPDHPLRRHLEECGALRRLLEQWHAEPCPPDLVGINYYVTSDRFLDSRLALYPRQLWGGNGRQQYCDVEAVRARPEGIVGHAALLEEAFQRYGAPCALTEVHLGCHREDQLRWLREAWQGAHTARAAGADVRAVTLWSAFGAVGWSRLVTSASGEYEPGVYDIRAPEPRPTALARFARQLAQGGAPDALASASGWWRRASRLAYPPSEQSEALAARPRLLVVGAGRFARRVAELCQRRFECTLAASGRQERLLPSSERQRAQPFWGLVLAADPAREAPALATELSRWLRASDGVGGARVLALSSAALFNGWSSRPYLESDAASASDLAGQSWYALENELIRACSRALIVRCGFVLDPELPQDPLTSWLRGLRMGRVPRLPPWRFVSPSYLPQLVHTALDLLVDGEHGIWHLAPRTPCSVLELARRSAKRLGLAFPEQAAPSSRREAHGPMRALASERGWPLPDLEETLEAYAGDLESRSEWRPALADNSERCANL
jgi:dTDP-4-dehydrorhamnose reductase